MTSPMAGSYHVVVSRSLEKKSSQNMPCGWLTSWNFSSCSAEKIFIVSFGELQWTRTLLVASPINMTQPQSWENKFKNSICVSSQMQNAESNESEWDAIGATPSIGDSTEILVGGWVARFYPRGVWILNITCILYFVSDFCFKMSGLRTTYTELASSSESGCWGGDGTFLHLPILELSCANRKKESANLIDISQNNLLGDDMIRYDTCHTDRRSESGGRYRMR